MSEARKEHDGAVSVMDLLQREDNLVHQIKEQHAVIQGLERQMLWANNRRNSLETDLADVRKKLEIKLVDLSYEDGLE